jgi:hypothetical protein
MLTLPGRYELLSDAWLEEARRFLMGDAVARDNTSTREGADARNVTLASRERWGSCSLSLSERYVEAPPHMGFAGGVASWSLRYDDERLLVTRDFDESADVVVEGDYQAGVNAAQGIGWQSPAAKAAMAREIAHMYGQDAIRVCGAPRDAQAADMLAILHNHMGRCTVENPDLAHRAARQGLTAKIREMEAQGFTVIERAISPAFADELRDATLHTLTMNAEHMPRSTHMMESMLYQGRAFELLAQNPLLLTLIDASLGRGAVMGGLTAVRHGPGPSTIPMHCDYQHVPEPFPDFALTGVGVWSLDDWGAESGGTCIVPGSHRMRRAPRPGENHEAAIPTIMPKGSVVFFTHGVWHAQGDRTESGDRVTLHQHMNRGFVRTVQPMILDVHMLHRNSHRLGEMLGEDDQFGKMTADGRDFHRIDYINGLQAFSDEKKGQILGGAR